MKLKKNTMVKNENGIRLCLGSNLAVVAEEDICILDMLKDGVTDDDKLAQSIAETCGDEITANLMLAQFVERYGRFLEISNEYGII